VTQTSDSAFRIRPLDRRDQAFLWDVLHIALWDPPPAPLRPREILEHPEVRIYAEDWGHEGDVGVVAEIDGKPIGACWMRVLPDGKGLGYVDDETPQLGIALLPGYQRKGYGEKLMRAALDAARARYRKVSLTVHPENPAIALYRRCGFAEVERRRTYVLMVKLLGQMGDATIAAPNSHSPGQ
jgi:ribosomal protein S18 acetylase RimI-like enzyme